MLNIGLKSKFGFYINEGSRVREENNEPEEKEDQGEEEAGSQATAEIEKLELGER